VKFAIEQGVDCKVRDSTITETTEDIRNYIKIGKFIQSICSNDEFNNTDKTLSDIIKQLEGESLTTFAVTSMKNYILKKKVVSAKLLDNIKDFTFLPETMKIAMCEAVSPFIKDFKENFELFEAEMLYLSGVISYPATYEESKAQSNEFSSDVNEHKEISDIYKLFKTGRTEEFCIEHFNKTYLPGAGITLLVGLIRVNKNLKDNVEELLGQVIPDFKIKEILESALAFRNYGGNEDVKHIGEKLESFKSSIPEAFYPISLEEAAKQKKDKEEKEAVEKKLSELSTPIDSLDKKLEVLVDESKEAKEYETPKYHAFTTEVEKIDNILTDINSITNTVIAGGLPSHNSEVDGGL
jgi:hypothetical protein